MTNRPESPDVEDYPCECCGNDPADCICPECPVCHEQGNPACYARGGKNDHGGDYTREQLIGQATLRIYRLTQQLEQEIIALKNLIGEAAGKPDVLDFRE